MRALFFLISASLCVLMVFSSAVRAELPEPWRQLRFDVNHHPQTILDELYRQRDDYTELKRYYELAHVYLMIAEAHRALGNEPASISAIEQGIQYARVSEAKYAEAELRLTSIRHYLMMRDFEEAESQQQRIANLAEQLKHRDLEIEAMTAEAYINGSRKNYRLALEQFATIEDNYHSSSPRVAFNFHNFLGDTYLDVGNYAEALNHYKQAAEVAGDHLGQWFQSVIRFNTGLAHDYLGETRTAQRLYEQVLEDSRSANDILSAAFAHHTLGNLKMVTGDYAEARSNYLKALEAFTSNKIERSIAAMQLGIAETYLYEEQWEQSQKWLERGQANENAMQELDVREYNAYLQSQLATSRGQHEDALDFYQEYARLGRERELQYLESNIQDRVAQAQSDARRALAQNNEAQTLTLKLQEKNRDLWYIVMTLGVILLLTTLALMIIYRRRLESQKTSYQQAMTIDRSIGLATRKHTLEVIRQRITQALVTRQVNHLLLLRIVNLDEINHQAGFDEGESQRRRLADILKQHQHEDDIIGGYSGRQFIWGCARLQASELSELAQEIRMQFQQDSIRCPQEVIVPQLEIAITPLDLDGESMHQWLKRAEKLFNDQQISLPVRYIDAPKHP